MRAEIQNNSAQNHHSHGQECGNSAVAGKFIPVPLPDRRSCQRRGGRPQSVAWYIENRLRGNRDGMSRKDRRSHTGDHAGKHYIAHAGHAADPHDREGNLQAFPYQTPAGHPPASLPEKGGSPHQDQVQDPGNGKAHGRCSRRPCYPVSAGIDQDIVKKHIQEADRQADHHGPPGILRSPDRAPAEGCEGAEEHGKADDRKVTAGLIPDLYIRPHPHRDTGT